MKVCQLLENDDWDNHSVMATDRTLFKIQKAQTHNFVSFCFELVRKYKPDLSGQYLQTASFFLNDAPRVWCLGASSLAGSQWSTTSLVEVTGDWQPASRDARMCSLPPNAEAADDGAVALDVVLSHVIEQPTTLADEFHQAASSVVVPLVLLQVLREVVDPSR